MFQVPFQHLYFDWQVVGAKISLEVSKGIYSAVTDCTLNFNYSYYDYENNSLSFFVSIHTSLRIPGGGGVEGGSLFGILTEGSAILIALFLDFKLSAASSDTAQGWFL